MFSAAWLQRKQLCLNSFACKLTATSARSCPAFPLPKPSFQRALVCSLLESLLCRNKSPTWSKVLPNLSVSNNRTPSHTAVHISAPVSWYESLTLIQPVSIWTPSSRSTTSSPTLWPAWSHARTAQTCLICCAPVTSLFDNPTQTLSHEKSMSRGWASKTGSLDQSWGTGWGARLSRGILEAWVFVASHKESSSGEEQQTLSKVSPVMKLVNNEKLMKNE